MIHANIRRTPIIFAALAALVLAVAALALYVHPTQAQDGSSQTSVSEGDTDLPNDNSTPGRVAVGSSATGAIGAPGDQDRFAVDLAADHAYQFDLTGSPGGGGTLPDTYFRAIYNSAGRYQSDSYNDDFGGSRDSRVTFTPTESGTYYARVSGDRDETGTYTLSVTDVTPEQAIPSKPTGLAGAATHDAVTLTWDDPDNDSITGYVILRRIPGVDPKGHFNELVANTGTAATTYTDNEVAAETRYTYRIKAINETGTSERSRWLHIDTPAAPSRPSRTQQESADPPTATEPSDGDFAASTETTAQVAVGQSIVGRIGAAGDVDWILVQADPGQWFTITLTGYGEGDHTALETPLPAGLPPTGRIGDGQPSTR